MIAAPQIQPTTTIPAAAVEKELELRRLMREMGRVLVAYSGGVDSSYLASIATEELGTGALCTIGLSPSVSEFQRAEARTAAIAGSFNFRAIDTFETDDPNYQANESDRCYFCKSELYDRLTVLAAAENIPFVADGTNADDLGDHRPGRAAADERKVRSPLAEVGLTKNEIRQLSRRLGLSGWDKPASPCLSSRIAFGVPVTIKRLSQVEAGEKLLRAEGFKEFRVRLHGDLVRLEIARCELTRALNELLFVRLTKAFKELGFKFVTLDMEGFRSGAFNPAGDGNESIRSGSREEQLEKV